MAPCASKAFLIFSASSLGIPSLSTFGTDSTNFFAYRPNSQYLSQPKKKIKGRRTSMSVRLGTSALTSLMTFGLAPPSNDSSFTLKIVFSFGLAAAFSSSASASSAFADPAAGSAAPAVGKAISWMLRRDCVMLRVVTFRC